MIQRVRARLALPRVARAGGVALAAVGALGASAVACSLDVSGIAGEPVSASVSSSGAGGGAMSSSAASGTSSGAGGSGGDGVVEGTTCLDIRDKGGSDQASRVYLLDPDGPGGKSSFKAYCEMKEDGGGWTLALKIDGKKDNFEYTAQLWENSDTHNSEFPDLDTEEAKLKSFSTVSFKEVRLGMIDSGALHWIVVSLPFGPAPSLEALFRSPVSLRTNATEAKWRTLVASPSLQPNCKAEGFNVISTNNINAKVRIGILGNDQMDCETADSLIGFGANLRMDNDYGGPSGNFAKDGGDNGDRETETFGYVLVR